MSHTAGSMTWSRVVVRALLLLALGVATVVLLSWERVYDSRFPYDEAAYRKAPDTVPYWEHLFDRTHWIERHYLRKITPLNSGREFKRDQKPIIDLPPDLSKFDLPTWVLDSDQRVKRILRLDFVAVGWPMRCLTCTVAYDNVLLAAWAPASNPLVDGITLSPTADTFPDEIRALPVIPIMPGLLIDGAVFAVPWWLALRGASALRSSRRRRRGLCVACRYDLTGCVGDVCPECGKGLINPSRQRMRLTPIIHKAINQ